MPEQLAYIQQRWIYLLVGSETKRIGMGRKQFISRTAATAFARLRGWEVISQKDANEILAERMKNNGNNS